MSNELDKSEEILSEVRELKHWLYGADGHEGDIPELKEQYKELRKNDACQLKKIHRIELILAASGIVGGGALGIIKLLGS